MSIMVIYGNNNSASIQTDCRATCTMQDGSIQYYENACKVRKFNKTIIGIIGDAKYANKIYESLKNSNYFTDKKAFINASFEDLYKLCIMYSKQYKNDFSTGQGCMISIAGINKDNKIVLDFFHTDDYVFHTTIPKDYNYNSKVFCNINETEISQKANRLINTTEEKFIPMKLHYLILEEVLPFDNSINKNYCFESISVE